MLHILISCGYRNKWVIDSEEKLNETLNIRHTCKTNFDTQIAHFMILIEKMAKLLLSLNEIMKFDITRKQDFSIVLLKL